MLEKEGAQALRCPMLDILDAPDDAPLLAWLDRLQAGAFAWVILLTGEGSPSGFHADRHARRDAVVAALTQTRTLIRGPKPGRALREIGLTATMTASAPTTDGVIASLRAIDLTGLTVGVQLYNASNPPLEQYSARCRCHVLHGAAIHLCSDGDDQARRPAHPADGRRRRFSDRLHEPLLRSIDYSKSLRSRESSNCSNKAWLARWWPLSALSSTRNLANVPTRA